MPEIFETNGKQIDLEKILSPAALKIYQHYRHNDVATVDFMEKQTIIKNPWFLIVELLILGDIRQETLRFPLINRRLVRSDGDGYFVYKYNVRLGSWASWAWAQLKKEDVGGKEIVSKILLDLEPMFPFH